MNEQRTMDNEQRNDNSKAAHLVRNVGHMHGRNAACVFEVLVLVSFVDHFPHPGSD